MKTMYAKLMGAVLFVLISSSPLYAQDSCSKEDVVQAVDQAVEILEAEGRAGLEKIGKLKFCGNNYVFVCDLTGKNLMHAKKSIIGKVLSGLKDDKGKQFFVDFTDTAKSSETTENGVTYYNGSGWVDYRWPKPNEKAFSQKASYIRGCRMESESVYAGAGIYVE